MVRNIVSIHFADGEKIGNVTLGNNAPASTIKTKSIFPRCLVCTSRLNKQHQREAERHKPRSATKRYVFYLIMMLPPLLFTL